jgi:hypothetical protein
MNMSLLSSPLFQQEDSSKQRVVINATTVAGRQTTSGDADTNFVVGGMEHESLLQDVSSWMREMESIHDNLQMTSVRRSCGTTKSSTRSSCHWVVSSAFVSQLVVLYSLHLGWLQVQNAIILDSLYMTGAVEE